MHSLCTDFHLLRHNIDSRSWLWLKFSGVLTRMEWHCGCFQDGQPRSSRSLREENSPAEQPACAPGEAEIDLPPTSLLNPANINILRLT